MIVSFKTAVKLEEAGFPQPAPKFGQVWYSKLDMSPMVFIKKAKESDLFIFRDFTGDRINLYDTDFVDIVFAAADTDILWEIGNSYFLMVDAGCFEVDQMSEQYGTGPAISRHENPAEACAMAWRVKRADIDGGLVKKEQEKSE